MIIRNLFPVYILNVFLFLFLFIFLSDAKARVWALWLPLQALIHWRSDGGAEEKGKVMAVVPIVEIILIGEVGRTGVSSS